jgi:membrane protein insertase Oxa1/YidC/SpoIIIJ
MCSLFVFFLTLLFAQQVGVMKVMTYIFPVVYLIFTHSFGQGLHLFWLASSAMALVVNFALRKSVIGKALGTIPAKPLDSVVIPQTTFTTKSRSLKKLKQEHKKKHD